MLQLVPASAPPRSLDRGKPLTCTCDAVAGELSSLLPRVTGVSSISGTGNTLCRSRFLMLFDREPSGEIEGEFAGVLRCRVGRVSRRDSTICRRWDDD